MKRNRIILTLALAVGLLIAGVFAITSQAAPSEEVAQPNVADLSGLPEGVTAEWLAAVRENLNQNGAGDDEPLWPLLGVEAEDSWSGYGDGTDGEDYGWSVASAGDVNGDGYADVIIGDPNYDADSESDEGIAYVYHGGPGGLSTAPNWSVEGNDSGDELGYSVAGAGDVNGDGYDDVIIGAPDADTGTGNSIGQAYIYTGTVNGLGATAAVTLSGDSPDGESFGWSVASAGDVNCDGYADVIVGDPAFDDTETNEGKVYVCHGSTSISSMASSWQATGDDNGDQFGYSVASAGDIQGDGYSDVIIGAPGAGGTGDERGEAYVFFGEDRTPTDGLGTNDRVADWYATADDTGDDTGDEFGWSVASAGDVNGDGHADIIVGDPGYDVYWDDPCDGGDDDDDVGAAYVFYAEEDGGTWDLGTSGQEADVAADWIAVGEHDECGDGSCNGDNCDAGDQFGYSVASAGDVNGDGYAEVVIGAPEYAVCCTDPGDDDCDPGSGCAWPGKIYVYQGGQEYDGGLGENNREADWTDTGYYSCDQGSAYFYTTQDLLGYSVASAGDVNGDGYADVIAGAIGMYLQDGTTEYDIYEGKANVYHGRAEPLSTDPDEEEVGQNAWDQFGHSVAMAGDVNGDGYSDVVIGAYRYDNYRGAVYIDFGGGTTMTLDTGEEANDYFGYSVAAAGDVDNDGYADVIVGAPRAGTGGKVYIYYGRPDMQQVGALNGWVYTTIADGGSGDEFGGSVAGAGDVDGDGYADVIVGAPGYNNNTGAAFVYYGSHWGMNDPHVWYVESSANYAWAYYGEREGDYFGASVAGAGDLNGNGYADVAVGAYGYDDKAAGAGGMSAQWVDKIDAGKVYVFHGSDDNGLSDDPDWWANGEDEGDRFGHAVATAGDVNADSFADLIVGAPYYSSGDKRGKVYVYYGSGEDLAAPLNGDDGLGSKNRNPDWWKVGVSDDDRLGWSVATAGDVNGDGYADVIIGSDGFDDGGEKDKGMVYVYHGGPDGLETVSWTEVWTASGENDHDYFGYSVSSAGDRDGDGFADIVIGAHRYTGGERQGKVYFYHGNDGNDGSGRRVLSLQMLGSHATDDDIVHPWGSAEDPDSFRVRMNATDPMGHNSKVMLELEACPPGYAFDDPSCTTYIPTGWTDVTSTTLGVTLTEEIPGLTVNTLYHWRARVLYAPVCCSEPQTPPHGPWRRFQAQAIDADLSTTVTDLQIEKTALPDHVEVYEVFSYTLEFINLGPGIATDVLITDVIPSPTFTVKSWDSSLGVDVGITDTEHTPIFVWEVADLVAGQDEVITVTGFITHTHMLTDPLYLSPGDYVFTDTAEIDVDANATNIRDVYKPMNNFSSAWVEYSVPSPVGGHTEILYETSSLVGWGLWLLAMAVTVTVAVLSFRRRTV